MNADHNPIHFLLQSENYQPNEDAIDDESTENESEIVGDPEAQGLASNLSEENYFDLTEWLDPEVPGPVGESSDGHD